MYMANLPSTINTDCMTCIYYAGIPVCNVLIINNIEVNLVTLNAIEQALMIIGIDNNNNNNIQIQIHIYC